MNIKRPVFFIVAALLVLGLAACTRSASQGPAATGGEGTQNLPSPQQLGNAFMTQTAQAPQQPQNQQTSPTATPAQAAPPSPTPQQPAATQPPAAPPPTSTPGVPGRYTLQPGEFPYCIARRYNINPDQLLAANNLSKNAQSYPGQTLVIPSNAKPFPGKRALAKHPAQYTVKAGDTIYTVACTFGDVSPDAIVAANNLKKPYTLQAGQTLQIP